MIVSNIYRRFVGAMGDKLLNMNVLLDFGRIGNGIGFVELTVCARSDLTRIRNYHSLAFLKDFLGAYI